VEVLSAVVRQCDIPADVYDEDTFVNLLAQKTSEDVIREQRHLEDELQKATLRSTKVAELFEILYEDNVSGKVSDEWFMQLSHKYEVERIPSVL